MPEDRSSNQGGDEDRPAYDLEDLGSGGRRRGGGDTGEERTHDLAGTFQRMIREVARTGDRHGRGASWTLRLGGEDLATTTVLRSGDASGRPDVVRMVIHQWADLLPEPQIQETRDGMIFILLRAGYEERDEAELARRNGESGEPLDVVFF